VNNITGTTKRYIIELLRDGIPIESFLDVEMLRYKYYGTLTELDFLNRIYPLHQMDSNTRHGETAFRDIVVHTQLNDDYEYGWVFDDERFRLRNGNDEDMLNFLCEVFHPEVRDESGPWKQLLEKINDLLRIDRFEFWAPSKISGRDLFQWRVYLPPEEKHYIPFSIRNKDEYKANKFRIPKHIRRQLYALVQESDEHVTETDKTGFENNTSLAKVAFQFLQKYYEPKCFVEEGKYSKTEDIELFLMGTSPPCVLDYMEAISQCGNRNVVTDGINNLFVLNNMPFKLVKGEVVNAYALSSIGESVDFAKEPGVRELIEEAQKQFQEGKHQHAIEKIWDAFERIKTYYSPQLDKKKSVEKVLETVCQSNDSFMSLLEEEFRALTCIGNDFRIRHHETTKAELGNELHITYLYRRCSVLIDLVLRFL